MSAPAALALTVTGLLAVFGAGAALVPESITGRGSAAETPAAAVAALTPENSGTAGSAGDPGPGGSATPAPAPSASSRSSARAPAGTPKPSATPAAGKNGRATTKAAAPKAPKAPTTKATPRKATPVGTDQVAQENEVIRLVNVERDRAGCGAVRLNTKLRTAMRLHVQELGTHDGLYLSHVSDDGRTFVQRAQAQGYRDAGGENVARGQRSAADVMSGWMDSDGHRANILNCSFKAIGVGRAKGVDGSLVWGQLFGRS